MAKKTLAAENAELKAEIEKLQEKLTEKDNQIRAIVSNWQGVVAEKDERIRKLSNASFDAQQSEKRMADLCQQRFQSQIGILHSFKFQFQSLIKEAYTHRMKSFYGQSAILLINDTIEAVQKEATVKLSTDDLPF
jgi:hypothetical protein